MRKGAVAALIVQLVVVLVAAQRRLDVKQDALFVRPILIFAGSNVVPASWDRGAILIGLVEGFVDSQSLGQGRLLGKIDDRAEIDADVAFEL